jgi:anti-sigma factor RsiW
VTKTTAWRRLNRRRDHRWAQPRVSDYLEGELPPRKQRRLAHHRELCPECDRLIRTLDALLAMLPSIGLPPDAALEIGERTAGRVLARIEEWS